MPSKLTAPFQILSPGRVNLIGEHLDYNEGVVLPAAIDRYFQILVRPLSEPVLALDAHDLGEKCHVSLQNLEVPREKAASQLPAYALYPAGVAWALQEAGYETPGMAVRYSSNIPIGAGLSSSAAVQVGFALAWQELAGWKMDPMQMAKLCQHAENAFVGVRSGLMDPFTVCFGLADHALRFDTRSLDWQPVALPESTVIVIADSKTQRSLRTSAYNDRRSECESALAILQKRHPQLKALRDLTPTILAESKTELGARLYARSQHVLEEIARVDDAIACLEQGNATGFGQLMFASHISLRDLFEVSSTELDILVEIAAGLPGCLGARLTGAGFGGCTVNLVEEELAEKFSKNLSQEYRKRTGKQASIYICKASQGARRI